MTNKANVPKTFSLTPIETQLIKTITDQQATMLSNTISFIAISRLNVTVTEDTRFMLNEEMNEITINQDGDK